MINIREDENNILFVCHREGETVESFLYGKNISSRLLRKLYRDKAIYLNGRHVKGRKKLNKGDQILVSLPMEENEIEAQEMDLEILYEDYDLLVINKSPNLVVHPTANTLENTLANGISYYYKTKGIKNKIRFINRLDMDTSGIILVAKNSFAHQQMALSFDNNEVDKTYLAIVENKIKQERGEISSSILKSDSLKKMEIGSGGKPSKTYYEVLGYYGEYSLLKIRIDTGRTHQIRVHLNSIGHPIVGDSLYGSEDIRIKRQALHSYSINIKNLRDGRFIKIQADMPKDMENFLNLVK